MNVKPEREAAEALLAAINNMGFDSENFADTLCRSHRTLQQNAMRAFAEALIKWADMHDSGNYDKRNEQNCKFATKVVASMRDDMHFPSI